MAIIKCPNCNQDVSDKAKNCPHCDYKINDFDEVERLKNSVSVSPSNTRNTFNPIAKKFNLVVMIVKVIGYFSAFISIIAFASIREFWWGLLGSIVIVISTWLSTLLFEAIAEGLNLLQDIKNKL